MLQEKDITYNCRFTEQKFTLLTDIKMPLKVKDIQPYAATWAMKDYLMKSFKNY